jgi:hypothetical protein
MVPLETDSEPPLGLEAPLVPLETTDLMEMGAGTETATDLMEMGTGTETAIETTQDTVGEGEIETATAVEITAEITEVMPGTDAHLRMAHSRVHSRARTGVGKTVMYLTVMTERIM